MMKNKIVAFITRRVSPNPLETDLVIDSSDPDFDRTGLHTSSMLQLLRMTTISKAILKRELGTVPIAIQSKNNVQLYKVFGLK